MTCIQCFSCDIQSRSRSTERRGKNSSQNCHYQRIRAETVTLSNLKLVFGTYFGIFAVLQKTFASVEITTRCPQRVV